MLVGFLHRNIHAVLRNSGWIRMGLMLGSLHLLCLKVAKNEIHSHETLHKKLAVRGSLGVCEAATFASVGGCEVFQLNDLSPHETILLRGKRSCKTVASMLVSSLRKMDVVTKNFRVVLTDRDEADTESLQCFCTIRLEIGTRCHVKLFPLAVLQPNSDLLFLASAYLPTRICYGIRPLGYCSNNVNNLHICTSASEHDISRLVRLLRMLQNLHSHSLGSYFYVPLGDKNISALSLAPFIGSVLAYSLFSAFCLEDFGFDPRLFLALAYLYTPFVLLFFVPCSHRLSACCIFFFSFVNFRYGFLYSLLVFARNLACEVLFAAESKGLRSPRDREGPTTRL